MKAIQIQETGSADVLRYVDLPVPTPTEGKVLVKVRAAGVNFIDVYFREGRYKADLPLVLGQEGSGTVEAIGPGVNSGLKVGDRVAWCGVLGAYAEYAVVPASQLVRVPDDVDLLIAAGVMLQGMTAHYLSHSTFKLEREHTALVHAAAGGVGLLLTQMAAQIGARVLATVSTTEKAALARDAGASDVILYTECCFDEEVRKLTDGRGVDVVYDSVGQSTFDKSLNCLKPRGLLALYGASSGAVPPFDLIQLSTKGSLFITRPSLGHYIHTRQELEKRATDVLNWVRSGQLKVRTEFVYPLAKAAEAHRDLEARRTTGKLLLVN
jgi:NADPH2:quinone reductase